MKLASMAICFALISGLLAAQEYQMNTPAANLDINGVVVTNPAGPAAVVLAPVMTTLFFNVSSTTVAMPFEIAISPWSVPSVTEGAFVTLGGQVVHINPFWPGTVFWTTGGSTTAPRRFPGNFSVPFTSQFPVLASAQMVIVDPENPEGFVLSQASEVEFLNF